MKPEPMDEKKLLTLLKQEERGASSYYTSQLAQAQTTAMERYLGEPYKNEIEGMPKVVSQDVEDTVNTIMPHMMRMFLGVDDLISVEDELGQNIEVEKQAAQYLEHLLFKKNDGKRVLHDFVFDGLLQRLGVVSVSYEEPKKQPPREYTGVSPERYQEFESSPEYKILEAQQGELGFDIKVQKTPRVGSFVISQVPPEEVAIATRSSSFKDADYHRRKQSLFLADIVTDFPEKRAELYNRNGGSYSDETDDLDSDERRQTRFEDENYDNSEYGNDNSRRKVDLLTEWVRVDFDGDEVVELRQIKRVGDVILENLEVDKSELIEWSPVRVSHRAIGRSVADQILELTKIKTDLMRFGIRNLEQILSPRTFVNSSDEDVLSQVIDRRVGDAIPVVGDPRMVVHESVTPDVTATTYNALQYYDSRVEQASGVMRHAQGNRDEGITDTADGIRRLQTAANARVELIGLWVQDGAERIVQSLLDLVAAHQDQPSIIRVSGKPMQIDPRGWTEDMTVTVEVGKAAETSEDKLLKLLKVAEKQEGVLQTAGPGNPLVGIKEYGNTLSDIVKEGGFRNPERYFKAIPEDYQDPQPQQQQDPKVQAEMAKIEMQKAKDAAQMQLDQQRMKFDQQSAAREMQFKEQLAIREAQTKENIETMRLQHEVQMNEARIASEREIALIRINQEREISIMNAELQREINHRKADDQKEMAGRAVIAKTNGVKRNRAGGDLSK